MTRSTRSRRFCLWICSSAGENVQREKMKKSSKKNRKTNKKGAPSALLLNTTFEYLFLAAFCGYMMVPLETTLHYLHKLLLNNYKRTNILLLLAHTNERTNARTTSSTCDIFFRVTHPCRFLRRTSNSCSKLYTSTNQG